MMKPTKYKILAVLSIVNFFIVTTIMKSLQKETPKYMTFDQFQIKFNKKYDQKDIKMREQAYNNNLALLEKKNCVTACGVTIFSDATEQQLKNLCGSNLIGVKPNDNTALIDIQVGGKRAPSSTSTSVDWRSKGAVTPVKNQGQCGSCWAFATIAQFESDMVIKGLSDNTIDLAEQILVDCDNISSGCYGGNCISASDLVISKGLSLTTTYPYNISITNETYSTTPGYQGICTNPNLYSFSTQKFDYYFGYTKLTASGIIKRLQMKPQTIYVTATSWHNYAPTATSQIFSCITSDSNSINTLNHAVLLVGCTSSYWIVKNSWGTKWGLNGYIYISNNPKFDCGIGFFVGASI